jgi:uncharacterized membrane protein
MHEKHEEFFKMSFVIVEIICCYISFLGALILCIGVGVSIFNLGNAIINLIGGYKIRMIGLTQVECLQKASFHGVRLQLGGFTALGLEILVVSDVLETLTKKLEDQSYENLGKLCAVAAFRTALSFFLGREIKEVMEDIEVEEKAVRRLSQNNLKAGMEEENDNHMPAHSKND